MLLICREENPLKWPIDWQCRRVLAHPEACLKHQTHCQTHFFFFTLFSSILDSFLWHPKNLLFCVLSLEYSEVLKMIPKPIKRVVLSVHWMMGLQLILLWRMLAHIERDASLTAPLAAGYSQWVPSEPELLPTVSMTPCQISDLCVVVYEFWELKKGYHTRVLDHWSYFLNYFFL